MAHSHQELTTTPTAIAGLVDGQAYTLYNRSDHEMFVEEAAAAPDVNSLGATPLTKRGGEHYFYEFQKAAGEDVYIWSIYPGAATPVVAIVGSVVV